MNAEPVSQTSTPTTDSISPEQTSPPLPKRKLSSLVIISCGILLVSLVLFLFLPPKRVQQPSLQQASGDPYKDWESYTNTDYGFTLKHPKDFKIIQTDAKKFPPQTVSISDKTEKQIIHIFPVTTEKRTENDKSQSFLPSLLQAFPLIGQVFAADELPTMQLATQISSKKYITSTPSVEIEVNASDATEMMISDEPTFSGKSWQQYSAIVPWTFSGGEGEKKLYARFKYANSSTTDISTTFIFDTSPPIGGIALEETVVGPNTLNVQLSLGAEDNLSGVSDMRVSNDPSIDKSYWQASTTTLPWPIEPKEHEAACVYVQYRDVAGNVSDVYSDCYTVDTTPPILYVEVEPSTGTNKYVTVHAYDELSSVAKMYLSNDPLFLDGVAEKKYEETTLWALDKRNVVWVKVEDSVGNITPDAYPAWGGDTALSPSPSPSPSPESPVNTTPDTLSTPSSSSSPLPLTSPSNSTQPPFPEAAVAQNYVKGMIASEKAVKKYWPSVQKVKAEKITKNGMDVQRAMYIENQGKKYRVHATSFVADNRMYIIVTETLDENGSEALDNYDKLIDSFSVLKDLPKKELISL